MRNRGSIGLVVLVVLLLAGGVALFALGAGAGLVDRPTGFGWIAFGEGSRSVLGLASSLSLLSEAAAFFGAAIACCAVLLAGLAAHRGLSRRRADRRVAHLPPEGAS